jgi:diguanylate cyclase (GGDEF)-like protein
MKRWLDRIDPWLRDPKMAHSTMLYALGMLPVLSVLWALQAYATRTPEVLLMYEPQWLGASQRALSGLMVWLLALGGLAWLRRQEEDALSRHLGYLAVTPTLVLLTLLWAGHGLRDTPLGITVVESLIVGRALFGLRALVPGMVLSAALVATCEALQWQGHLSLAPMLRAPVFTGGDLLHWWALWMRLIFSITVWPFILGIVYLFASLHRHRAELEALVSTDMLTGLLNRREWMSRLSLEAHRHHRASLPLSVVMIDVDHFKRVNDEYGHPAGDAVLERMGALIRQGLRQDIDLGGRMGGEEFALLLPETDLPGAQTVALKLRDAMRLERFEHEGQSFGVTISAGVAEVQGDQGSQALRVADERLYRAKALGRDRVVTVMR